MSQEEWTGDEPIMVGTTYRRSWETAELFGALAKAQASYGTLEKTKTAQIGARYSYTYATLADTIDATKALHENGISVLQMPTFAGDNIAVTTILGHQSGQWIESTIAAAPTELTVQAMGSVITYLRRYALQAIAGIAPDDDDGAAGVRAPAKHLNPPAAAAPRPTPLAPPTNPETGEIRPPHAIAVSDLNWLEWGALYIAALKTAETHHAIDAWRKFNATQLKSMAEHAPKAYRSIEAATAQQAAKIGPAIADDDLATAADVSRILSGASA